MGTFTKTLKADGEEVTEEMWALGKSSVHNVSVSV